MGLHPIHGTRPVGEDPPSQAEAEAGTAKTARKWTAERVKQAFVQASQTAIEAETNEDTYIPPDLMKHNPGVTGAWVKFDIAGTINSGGSHNVDSVSDTGTGDWTVNITTDFSSVEYSVVPGLRDDNAGANRSNINIGAQAAGSFQVLLSDATPSLIDAAAADDMHAIACGDHA